MMQFLWLALPIVVSVVGIVVMLVRRARRVPPTPQELGSLLNAAGSRVEQPRRAGDSRRSPGR